MHTPTRVRVPIITRVALVALVTTIACGDRQLFAPEGVGTLVVDGVLVVGQAMPPVYVSETLRPDAPYTVGAAAVTGAAVSVSVSGETLRFVEAAQRGAYVALVDEIIRPETTYTLRVEAPDGRVVTAVTTTPARFDVEAWLILDDVTLAVRDTLATFREVGAAVYDSTTGNVLTYDDGLLEARFSRIDVPGFQVALESLDLDSDYVIDPAFFDEEDFEELERVSSSPLLEAPDGTIRLPWLAIYFAGRYRSIIYAVDRNWFDLVRTSPELGEGGPGFGGNLGDGVDQPVFHVEGGIGLFGSAAVDSIGFFVRPRP